MTALPGDVILVRFPFTDLTTTKLRPAVVLTTRGDDLTIVGIFSTPSQPARETWIILSTEDPEFSATGLKTASVLTDLIAPIPPTAGRSQLPSPSHLFAPPWQL